MKKPKVTPGEQAERDRRWRETLERQNRGEPVHGRMSEVARARYYEERQKAEDLDQMVSKYRCECGAELAVTFVADAEGVNIHHLRCGQGHVDPAVVPQASVYELWRDGKAEVPIYIANQYEKRLEREVAKMTPGTTVARREEIETLAQRPVITEQEAMTLLNAIWPDAPLAAKQRAAIICRQYELNPMMGHVALIQFKNKWVPVLEIKATRIIAQREGRYSYLENSPRMMTQEEQEAVNGEVDEKNWWAITVIRDQQGNIYRGYGSYPKAKPADHVGEFPYGASKGNTPQNMSHIRSERKALDKFAPGKLPQDIEVYEGPAVEVRDIAEALPALGEALSPLGEETMAPPAAPDLPMPENKARAEWNELVAKANALKLKGIPTLAEDAPEEYIHNALVWLGHKVDEKDRQGDTPRVCGDHPGAPGHDSLRPI